MSKSGEDKYAVQIVDDKSENLKILMKILMEQDYEVRTSINGTLALKSIRANPPDLILLDIRMPGMDGFEVCGHLKADEHTRDIPVIFISALHETADKIRAFSIGGVDYVTKPFQEEEVLARVSTHLSLRKAQQRIEVQNRHLQEEIAERQRIEDTLHQSRDILNATGKMARVGGWELDAETLEMTWTEQTYRIHEVPLDHKPLLQKAINFYHPEDRDMLSHAIQRALENGEPYDMEIRFITAKGRHLWTRSICEPVLAGGKVTRLKGTFQDITDYKQAGEQIQRAKEEAERANQAKSSFLANMSHELRTPLNAILGFSQMMRNRCDLSPECLENLTIIQQRGDDLLAIINRMIDIARIEDAPAAAERIDAVLKELQQGDGAQKSDAVRQLETNKFAASLTELPSGLLADLEQAILNVDVGQIYRIIERIRTQDAALADALKENTDNFEYETILTLIK